MSFGSDLNDLLHFIHFVFTPDCEKPNHICRVSNLPPSNVVMCLELSNTAV